MMASGIHFSFFPFDAIENDTMQHSIYNGAGPEFTHISLQFVNAASTVSFERGSTNSDHFKMYR